MSPEPENGLNFRYRHRFSTTSSEHDVARRPHGRRGDAPAVRRTGDLPWRARGRPPSCGGLPRVVPATLGHVRDSRGSRAYVWVGGWVGIAVVPPMGSTRRSRMLSRGGRRRRAWHRCRCISLRNFVRCKRTRRRFGMPARRRM